MSRRIKPLSGLEERIGYRFGSQDLLAQAVTHSSAVAPTKRTAQSYQRLEFLGDRVLGLVVADLLNREMPDANEGELSRALNALVRRETCAEVARDLDIGAFVRLGEAEARTGGADKSAILADVAEALIGAIYLDAGLEAAAGFVTREFGARMDPATSRRADAKTALQEWAQARGLEPPSYDEVTRSGPDHAPVFVIAVSVAGFEAATAEGPSKKLAEHQAAEAFLRRESIWRRG
ncbi:MAG: ribonuclease III [Alphaproteobacteria bacterium]|nr:ribonuclease III [Alphaproteobacteria bacterium]